MRPKRLSVAVLYALVGMRLGLPLPRMNVLHHPTHGLTVRP